MKNIRKRDDANLTMKQRQQNACLVLVSTTVTKTNLSLVGPEVMIYLISSTGISHVSNGRLQFSFSIFPRVDSRTTSMCPERCRQDELRYW